MKFVEGDVVTRKVGGPMMTVEDVRPRDDDLVACIWFDGNNQVQRDCFAANTLLKWQIVKEDI